MPTPFRPPASRRGCQLGSRKSKSGCRTCKLRKIKCDETRPVCYRCSSTGRRCDGPRGNTASPESRPSPPQANGIPSVDSPERQFGDLSSRNAQDRRAFEYFFDNIAPVLSGVIDMDFWRRLIPRLSLSEPCVWDAVMSISILYEHPQFEDSPMLYMPGDEHPISDENHQLAVKSYNRAISRFNEITRQGASAIPLALVTCILFICIEFLQDNTNGALKLYGMCCNLLQDNAGSVENPRIDGIDHYYIKDLVAPIVFRLGVLSAITGGPLPPAECELTNTRPDHGFEVRISSLAEARTTLHSFMQKAHAFIRKGTLHARYTPFAVPPSDSILAEQSALIEQCDRWHAGFSHFMRHNSSRLTQSEKSLSSILFMWDIASKLWLHTCLSPYETEIDKYTPLVQLIVDHGRSGISYASSRSITSGGQPPFTFEMGVIPPLYVAALRCRHPRVRREAYALLKQSPRKEGPWKSIPMARMLDRVFELEEDGLYPPGTDFMNQEMMERGYTLPPEEKRLHAHKLFRSHDDHGELVWCLQYELRTMNEEGLWERMDHVITMENL